jgi:GDPmannose 4,6-dehydratase
MHSMLQLPNPDDFVIASEQAHSVRELCEIAFAEADLDYGEFVKVDQRYYRPSEVDQLVGDASKAHRVLGWEPTYTFRDLVKEMVASDLALTAYANSNTR